MRNMFIICEGIDNVGKSTLIQNLKNHYNDYTFHTLHYSAVKQDTADKVIEYSTKMYTEMFEIMMNQIKYDNSGIICDRSHLGELVYGPEYRGYTGEYVLDIERKWHHIHSVWDNLILFTIVDKPERAIERDDGLSFSTDLDKKQKEIDAFLNAHNKSTIKHKYIINIETFNAEQVTKIAVDYIENFVKGNKDD